MLKVKQVQGSNYFLTHIEVKRFYRYCLMREYLHTVNSAGLYHINQVRNCARVTRLSYNTLRNDINIFADMGLLVRANGFVKLHRLSDSLKSLHTLFKLNRQEIEKQSNPALYFADLYKKKIVFANVIAQSFMEAEKINDEKLKRKYLKHIRQKKAPVGVKEGIFLSLRTIGNIFDRGKTTAYKFIERMNNTAILKIKKNISSALCPAIRINDLRKAENLCGRLFVKDGFVFERLQNSYQFNF
jgi:hypothetical protein